MEDKLLNMYEIAGGAWIMLFPFFWMKGIQPSLLLLLAGSAALYLTAVYLKNIIWYLLTVSLLFGMILVPDRDILSKAMLGIGAGIGSIGYFTGRLKEKAGLFTGVSFWYLFLTVPAYLLAIYWKDDMMKSRTCLFAAVLVVLCILYENHKAIVTYVTENEKLHRFPKKRLMEKNRYAILIFTLIVFLGMGVGYFGTPEVTFQLKPIEVNLTPEVSEGQSPSIEMPKGDMFGEYREAPVWLKFLGEILYKLTGILVVIFVLILIGVLLYRVYRKYQKSYKSFKIAGAGEEEDQIERVGPREKGFLHFFEKKSPAEWIRKYYKKWIQRALKQVPVTASPSELEERAGISDMELHELYEKARYSQKICTREESIRVKQKMH